MVQIFGVVPDGGAASPRPDRDSASLYLPLKPQVPLLFSVVVRTHSPAEANAITPHVNRVIANVTPSMPWTTVETASAVLAARTRDSRSMTFLVGAAGVVGLLLSAAGLFAVMSYTVSLRTREIGVRVALGGRSSDVARLVLREAIRLTTVGAAIGLTLSIPLAFLLRAALFGVSPLDPWALIWTIGLLLVAAIGAATIPALRAASTSPLVAIQTE
jgi:putative ABC transport system permease protein